MSTNINKYRHVSGITTGNTKSLEQVTVFLLVFLGKDRDEFVRLEEVLIHVHVVFHRIVGCFQYFWS